MRSANAAAAPSRIGGSAMRTATSIVVTVTNAIANVNALLPMHMEAATVRTRDVIANRSRPMRRAPRRTATIATRTRIRMVIDGPATTPDLPTVALARSQNLSQIAIATTCQWMTQKSDRKRDTNPRMTDNRRQSDEHIDHTRTHVPLGILLSHSCSPVPISLDT